jgi:hypothetical protein
LLAGGVTARQQLLMVKRKRRAVAAQPLRPPVGDRREMGVEDAAQRGDRFGERMLETAVAAIAEPVSSASTRWRMLTVMGVVVVVLTRSSFVG